MKTKILLSIVLLSFVTIASAQNQANSTYLFEDFQQGKAISKSGKIFGSLFNYELTSGRIHFKEKGEILELAYPESMTSVEIGKHIFEHIKGNEFYEKIKLDKTNLYIKHKGTLIPQGKNSGYGGRSQTASIGGISRINTADGKSVKLKVDTDFSIKKRNVYYLNIDGKFKSFNSVNSLAKLFGGNQEQVKEILSNEDIDFGDTEDVIKAVRLCEQYLP